MKESVKKRIKKVKLLILDVDGVLTNGDIILNHQGQEIKKFNVHDGFGIVFFRRAGFKVAILSARSAPAVTARAKDLKIDKIIQDARPKLTAYRKMMRQLKLRDEQACFMADDLPDIQVLKKVGFAVAVPNAATEVKKVAHYTTRKEGGQGAVREVVEMILKSQNKWKNIVKDYS